MYITIIISENVVRYYYIDKKEKREIGREDLQALCKILGLGNCSDSVLQHQIIY